jgi:hypothetical protein
VLREQQIGDQEPAQGEEEGDRGLAAKEEGAVGRVGQPGRPLVHGDMVKQDEERSQEAQAVEAREMDLGGRRLGGGVSAR